MCCFVLLLVFLAGLQSLGDPGQPSPALHVILLPSQMSHGGVEVGTNLRGRGRCLSPSSAGGAEPESLVHPCSSFLFLRGWGAETVYGLGAGPEPWPSDCPAGRSLAGQFWGVILGFILRSPAHSLHLQVFHNFISRSLPELSSFLFQVTLLVCVTDNSTRTVWTSPCRAGPQYSPCLDCKANQTSWVSQMLISTFPPPPSPSSSPLSFFSF